MLFLMDSEYLIPLQIHIVQLSSANIAALKAKQYIWSRFHLSSQNFVTQNYPIIIFS